MTGQEQQIVTAHETLNLSPAEIAEQMDIDVTAVKACLFQYSTIFKKDARKDDKLNFNDNELIEANQTILHLMKYSEDENLRGRLARYVRDDKKGRLDIGSNLTGTKMNVLQFNTFLLQARESINETKKLSSTNSNNNLIDVQSEKVA